jgi:hypothetical protein
MAEPKKPAGATHEAGPEEPTRYAETMPMGEGEEGEGGLSFDYGTPPGEEAPGEEATGGFSFEYGTVGGEEAPGEEATGGLSFEYGTV